MHHDIPPCRKTASKVKENELKVLGIVRGATLCVHSILARRRSTCSHAVNLLHVCPARLYTLHGLAARASSSTT